MKLLLKFNLVFVLVFVLGLGATGYITRDLLQRNAQDEVLDHARLLMEKALAVRGYTSGQIAPLLETQTRSSLISTCAMRASVTRVPVPCSRTASSSNECRSARCTQR